MNLFQKYGIKEVADVVFYSITTVGDEEFYTPVLFLDTLKVSTLEKAAEKVEAKGGKGNKKLITWNFGKEITLNLEDALFSPASMSMIWGGKLNSKLSDYTSAVVKGNLANKYYDLHYSTKAYPSPALTNNEWEIVFTKAQEYTINSESGAENPSIYLYGEDGDENKYVDQNRASFIDKYFKRNRVTLSELELLPKNTYMTPITQPKIYSYEEQERTTKKVISISLVPEGMDQILNTFNSLENGASSTLSTFFSVKYVEATNENTWEEQIQEITTNASLVIAKTESGILSLQNGTMGAQNLGLFDIISFNGKEVLIQDFSGGTGGYITINLSEVEKLINKTESPMPQIILSSIISELNSLEKIGYIDTDFHDLEVIDRMEKCIVKNREGLTISCSEQKNNLFKFYADDKTSSYTIFYDAKTMLPLFPIENGIIQEANDNFTIKMGTVYYKWTRTVKYKESEDDAILGKTLVIDAETFPDAYKIVGETYIRNQKTGKDQRYQFIIHRANVSTDTSVTLEAEGDPTTFSMQVDVLTPPNDIMMELKQYDVEDDPIEGGTRIVPQKSKYTYTPTNIEYAEEIADKNEEIY